jgi:Predicted xylanase/chitin deacetylase
VPDAARRATVLWVGLQPRKAGVVERLQDASLFWAPSVSIPRTYCYQGCQHPARNPSRRLDHLEEFRVFPIPPHYPAGFIRNQIAQHALPLCSQRIGYNLGLMSANRLSDNSWRHADDLMLRAVLFAVVFVLTHASLLLLYPFSGERFLLCSFLFASGTACMLWVLFHPQSQWLVDARCRVTCQERPCIALTFDDGPTAEHTVRILDVLRDKGVSATFFLVGNRVERFPELARRICAEGHEIGNHTYSHPSLFCFLTPGRLREEIERGQDAISRACGVRPRYFRSPVGLRHALLRPYLKSAGLEYISWRIRSFDTIDSSSLRTRILGFVRSGDIILLHDNSQAERGGMVDVIPGVIDELRNRGYRLVPVES